MCRRVIRQQPAKPFRIRIRRHATADMPKCFNARTHGLMFHHCHGPGFAPNQGSITADTFASIIGHYTETQLEHPREDHAMIVKRLGL